MRASRTGNSVSAHPSEPADIAVPSDAAVPVALVVPDALVAPDAPAAPRRRWPRRLWLIVALQGLLMLCTTILYPAFQNPDEHTHVDYVLAHRDGQWLDGPGERLYQTGVIVAFGQVPFTQHQIHVGGTPPLPRAERKSFDALGTAPDRNYQPDQMVQHPPLYYGLAAGWTYLLPDFANRSFEVQVFWLRLFSILLMLPVPLLIYAAAHRVSGRPTLALVAALLPLSVPSYLRTGASVNNDSLLVLLTTALLVLLVRVVWAGDLSRRTALSAGAIWGADLLTKGFALGLAVVIVACYLLGASGPIRDRIRASWLPVVLCGGLGAAIGAWWWIRNKVVYGAIQPDGLGFYRPITDQQLFAGHPHPGSDLRLIPSFLGVLAPRIWGSLGLIDVPSLPRAGLWLLAGAAFVLVVVSIVHREDAIGWRPVRAGVLILPLLLTLAIMVVGTRRIWRHSSLLGGVQVRYVVPDFLGLAICLAVALCWLAGRHRRWLPPALLTATLLFIAASAERVLDIEMAPALAGRFQRIGHALEFVAGWAPWRAWVSTLIVGVTALVALGALIAFWLAAATERPPATERDPAG